LPQGTHRLLVDPTPGIEVPDIYAVGKVSMAARLREKWVEVRSSAGAKELSDVAVGFSASRLAKLYLVAGGELFPATRELLLVCLASLLGLVISLHVDR
jgi:hypothetical protein